MINLDDRILSQVNESELWVLLNLAKRMRQKRMCAWPSIDTLAIDCGWTVNTARKWRDSLVKKGFIKIEQRLGTSPLVTLSKSGISIFTPLDGDYEEEEPLPKIGTPPLPKIGTPPLPKIGSRSKLTNEGTLTSEGDAPTQNDENIFDWFGKRPGARTGVELADKMKELYNRFPEQFRVDIMEGGKAAKFTKDQRGDILMKWACHMITVGKENDTYQRLNAELQKWFLSQPAFQNSNTSQTGQPQAKTVDIKIGK